MATSISLIIVYEIKIEKCGALAESHRDILSRDAQDIRRLGYLYLLKTWKWSILMFLM